MLVIDTSVVIKWYIPEPGATQAAALRHPDNELIAPDLLVAEFGNVLRKKARQGELNRTEAVEIAEAFARACPVRLRPALAYSALAVELAIRFQRSVYDALYLAVALADHGSYVTADERLINALAHTELASITSLLGN
jgi:predicted nucleic acid-binding protein